MTTIHKIALSLFCGALALAAQPLAAKELKTAHLKMASLLLLASFSNIAFSQELNHKLIGWFYRPQKIDAMNLAILPNGTFRWHVDGCDYADGGKGLWRQEGDMLVFYSRDGKGFTWSDGSMRTKVLEVHVKTHSAGILTTITNRDNTPQLWEFGAVCAQCEGAKFGPTGLPKVCTPPNVYNLK